MRKGFLRVETGGATPTVGEALGALSYALDLVEGQPQGHCMRTWRIAQRIGATIGLSDTQLDDLYYASALKDSGCSNNSARIQSAFGGDELVTKRLVKLVDWSNPVEAVKFGVKAMASNRGLVAKLRQMAMNVGPPSKLMDEVTSVRCTRGAAIALHLGLSTAVADAVSAVDEHWDGKGSPLKRRGDEIPILARILCLAQTLEIFATTYAPATAFEMAGKRSSRWFDPTCVLAAKELQEDAEFWTDHQAHVEGIPIPIPAPSDGAQGSDVDIDNICTAFADVVDAKSSFTGEHSQRVTKYAIALGQVMEFKEERLQTLKRAALLHDIGKLGVSTGILDKPGKLTETEFAEIKQHPKLSFEVLNRITGFGRISAIASAHHERLDGLGYWRGLSAESLDLDVRILTAADVFDALTAHRPYREALPVSKVLSIMEADVDKAFDGACVDALRSLFGSSEVMAA